MKRQFAFVRFALPAVVSAGLLTGCRSPMFEGTVFAPKPDTEGARLRMAQEQMLADVERSQARLEAVEQTQRRLDDAVTALDSQVRAGAALRAEVAALRREVAGLRAERDQLRKEVVDDLSARIGKLMAAQGGAAPAGGGASGSGGRQAGRLHKVERGQTLSVIAQAYKTTVDKIMRANNLTNPNQVREGAELFIPE